MNSNLIKDLNPRQKAAVSAPLGPVLVLAGAGSGKTRALTHRIAWLVSQGHFKPEEILALTFTNKAAGEMKQRITALLTEELKNQRTKEQVHKFMSSSVHPSITMGTFHSVCARILRKEVERLGNGRTRNFVIYDTEDQNRILKQIILELGVGDNFKPGLFSYYISYAKNRLLSPTDLDLDNSRVQELLTEVSARYEQQLAEANAVDFDDLLTMTYTMFRTAPASLKKYQNRFKYVLVDEYQDTNHVQYMLLKLLVANHNNIFVVGDDAQSIYGFRGANMQNILDFKKDYPKAKVIMLEQNYRSTVPILNVANSVIKLNSGQYEKKLWTDMKKGEKVGLYEAQSDVDEARFVVTSVIASPESARGAAIPSSEGTSFGIATPATPRNDEELIYELEDTPILDKFMKKSFRFSRPHIPNPTFLIPDDLHEQVILYRTHAQSRAFEEMLVRAGIPYQIVGGVKFYERKEIKDALAYMRLSANPRDLVSLNRVINVPARGIGPAAFRKIAAGLAKYDYNYQRLLNNLDQLELADKALAGAGEFFSLYSDPNIRNPNNTNAPEFTESDSRSGYSDKGSDSSGRYNSSSRSILDIMNLLLKRSGYREYLFADREEGEQRWENIQQLFNVAAKFTSFPLDEGISSFLEEIALMTDMDSMEDSGNKLTLMTLHSAKGLEFKRVFLVGLEEGLLPHARSIIQPEEIAEEIRLAYVGMTRAKKELYLSWARERMSYGELKAAVPSRILKAIPERLLHKISN